MNAAALIGATLIGLILGLTGAGGSIITLPVLVYAAGVSPPEAVGLSLCIVGAASFAGALQRWRAGEVHLRVALMFTLAGAVGAAVGAQLTPLVAPAVLMNLFALLMLVIGIKMLLQKNEAPVMAPECQPLRCLLAGGAVGVLTGFIGVGGGFLLVPALVKFARLPLRIAAGTSLAIIAFNSAAGALSHQTITREHWPLVGTFSVLAILGVLAGNVIGHRLSAIRLRQAFAALVLITAVWVLLHP
ncbi:sulfite exporter TauE/SafE family protein [soil metagenome]